MTLELGINTGLIITIIGLVVKYAMDYQSMKSEIKNIKDNHCKDVEHLEEKLNENKNSSESHFNSLETKMDKVQDLIMELIRSIPKRENEK